MSISSSPYQFNCNMQALTILLQDAFEVLALRGWNFQTENVKCRNGYIQANSQ